MDLTPKLLTASVLFALAEQKYGKELRSLFRLKVGRASELFVVVEPPKVQHGSAH